MRDQIIQDRGLEFQSLDNEDLSLLNADDLVFRSCVFSSVSFSSSVMERVVFDGCTFTDCDLSFSSLQFCSIRSCKFISCAFHSAQLTDSRIVSSSFEQSNFHYASFGQCKIEKTVFSLCDLRESDLSALKHKKLSIVSSDLERAVITGTCLKDLDLSESKLDGLLFSDTASELRGAELDVSQLIQIAPNLGIKLKI